VLVEKGLAKGNFTGCFQAVDTLENFAGCLPALKNTPGAVLFKGSRSQRMEDFLERFLADIRGAHGDLSSAGSLSSQVGFFNVFRYITFRAIYAFTLALVICIFLGPRVIRWLTKVKCGQYIHEDVKATSARPERPPWAACSWPWP